MTGLYIALSIFGYLVVGAGMHGVGLAFQADEYWGGDGAPQWFMLCIFWPMTAVIALVYYFMDISLNLFSDQFQRLGARLRNRKQVKLAKAKVVSR